MSGLRSLSPGRAIAAARDGRLSWLPVVGAAALGVRILYVLVVLHGYSPVSDAEHYHTLAGEIAAGRGFVHGFPFGFSHPTAFRPPLYPALLGGLYAVVGVRVGAAEALNVMLGTGVVVLVALLASRMAGWQAGVVAGGLAAVYPPLVFNDGPPLSEPLGLLLLVAAFLFLFNERVGWAGIATGLLVLTRPSAQFVALAFAVWVLWRLGWRRAVSYLVPAVLVVAPWVARNWVRLGSPVLVTSNGFNLAAMYSAKARAAGGFVDPFTDPRLAGITNEADLDSALRRYTLDSLADDPGYVFELGVRNAKFLSEIDRGPNEIAERLDGRNIRLRRLTIPLVWAVMATGIGGMWVMRRQRGVGPLVLAGALFTAVSIVSVAAPRLRAPLDLICCISVGLIAGRLLAARQSAGAGHPQEPAFTS